LDPEINPEPAQYQSAVLVFPDVIFINALFPKATFLYHVESTQKSHLRALLPIATLSYASFREAAAHHCRALFQILIFDCPARVLLIAFAERFQIDICSDPIFLFPTESQIVILCDQV
jgi:hypothetical protein